MKDFFKHFWERFRLLPLLVVVASLAFMIRVGDAAMKVRQLSGAASAQEATTTADKTKADDKAKKDDTKTDTATTGDAKKPQIDLPSTGTDTKTAAATDKNAPVDPKKDLSTTPKTDWKDAGDTDIEYSEIRQDVYKDLLQRRQQLDEREKQLEKREALLGATRDEITGKVKELTSLKTEIQKLLEKQTEAEQENTTRLVRIYEGMKPKDAARIFNELDIDVLVTVLSKMGEKKSGAIIAAMDAEKARRVTLLLSEDKQLPDLVMDGGAADSGPNTSSSGGNDQLPSLGQERDQTSADQPPPPPS